MQFTRQQARREIEELNLPELFVEIFDGTSTLLELEISKPIQAFRAGALQHPASLTPIFEHRGDTYFCEHRSGDRLFVAFNLETPGQVTAFGSSFQCVLAALFMAFWNDQRNDFLLSFLAERLEFNYLPELLDSIRAANKLEQEPFRRWREQFWQYCEVTERDGRLSLQSALEDKRDWTW